VAISKKRARKNRILEDEAQPQPQRDDGKFPKIIEEIAEREGKTVDEVLAEGQPAITRDDMMWIGGRRPKSASTIRIVYERKKQRPMLFPIAKMSLEGRPDTLSYSK
jgi:hypothetical protein